MRRESKDRAGIVDFICGLYLQDRHEIARHFSGDFAAVIDRNFPIHRFGQEGLVPKVMLDEMSSEADSCDSGFTCTLRYSDELHRLLWLSARLANAVGKKASMKDVVAAVTLDRDWQGALLSADIFATVRDDGIYYQLLVKKEDAVAAHKVLEALPKAQTRR